MDECRRTGERLTPYVDEVLPPGERSEVDKHLQDCPPCRTAATEEQGGRTVLRDCAGRLRAETLPPGLRSRCEALAREHGRVRRAAWWRTRFVPVALVAALVMVIGLGLLSLATRRSTALLAAQLTADHVKCFKVFAPSGETDASQVQAQLEGYGWDLRVPPSSPENGVRLLGGRRCLYADGTIPHVMYQAGAQQVSLFRLDGVSRPEATVAALGHRCRIWSRDGHTYVLVASESADADLDRIARYVQEQAR